ncbi:uncharacterized protein LOC142356592, partial [Convolutriloba macropyga]|uniref:uncharacterized protein LOC142356592 n=1 Tax=Convolutriloba macropyga TaxID=536237 RepID=UPI003F51C7F0
MSSSRRSSSHLDAPVDETDFQRRRSVLAEKKEKGDLERLEREDEKMEEILVRYAEENKLIAERAHKRREQRAKREEEFRIRKMERQKRFDEEMAQLKIAEEKRKAKLELSHSELTNATSLTGTVDEPDSADMGGRMRTNSVKKDARSPTLASPTTVKKKTQEEIEEEEDEKYMEARDKAVAARVPQLKYDSSMGREKLTRIATELYERLKTVEEEKYDLKVKFRKQKYELKEVSKRIEEIQRRNRLSSKMESNPDYTSGHLLQELIS